MKNRTFRNLTVALAIVSSLFATSCTHNKALYKPAPIQISHKSSNDQVGKTVKRVLIQRGWTVVSEAPGQTTAQVRRGQYSAKVKLSYDAHKVDINYLDSQNLYYKKNGSQETIHSRYNLWVERLQRDLEMELAKL